MHTASSLPPPDPTDREARAVGAALDDWLARGLLSPELTARLRADLSAGSLRPVAPAAAPAAAERKLGRGVSILVNLGAIILAAGLIVFFASNWVEFGRAAKIASLFVLTLGFYLAGFELTAEGRWSFPKLGLALVFLGCVMFGVDILLLALIYDLTAENAWALLTDTLVWFGVAYLLRSRLILFLALIGLASWFGAQVGYCWGGYWIYLGRPYHFIGLGLCLIAIAGIHAWRGQRDFSAPFALVGLLLLYLSTLILSIFDLQRGLVLDWSGPLSVWLMLYGPFLFALAAVAVLHLCWRQLCLTDPPALLVLFLFACLLMSTGIAWMPGQRTAWFILLLTLLTSAGIYLGIAWESPVFLNTSLTFFALNVYTRYYEYCWDAMPKSLFFILGGATLMAGGIYVERMRRRIVRQFVRGAA